MSKITHSNGSNGGSKNYDPEVEFVYVDSDVWIAETKDTKDVTYTDDVLKAIEKSQEEDQEPEDSES